MADVFRLLLWWRKSELSWLVVGLLGGNLGVRLSRNVQRAPDRVTLGLNCFIVPLVLFQAEPLWVACCSLNMWVVFSRPSPEGSKVSRRNSKPAGFCCRGQEVHYPGCWDRFGLVGVIHLHHSDFLLKHEA